MQVSGEMYGGVHSFRREAVEEHVLSKRLHTVLGLESGWTRAASWVWASVTAVALLGAATIRLPTYTTASGVVERSALHTVVAPFDGMISTLNTHEGDAIRAGGVVAELTGSPGAGSFRTPGAQSVLSTVDGTVDTVLVRVGDSVRTGDVVAIVGERTPQETRVLLLLPWRYRDDVAVGDRVSFQMPSSLPLLVEVIQISVIRTNPGDAQMSIGRNEGRELDSGPFVRVETRVPRDHPGFVPYENARGEARIRVRSRTLAAGLLPEPDAR
jgi:biotin carboxyl carrier protein